MEEGIIDWVLKKYTYNDNGNNNNNEIDNSSNSFNNNRNNCKKRVNYIINNENIMNYQIINLMRITAYLDIEELREAGVGGGEVQQ